MDCLRGGVRCLRVCMRAYTYTHAQAKRLWRAEANAQTLTQKRATKCLCAGADAVYFRAETRAPARAVSMTRRQGLASPQLPPGRLAGLPPSITVYCPIKLSRWRGAVIGWASAGPGDLSLLASAFPVGSQSRRAMCWSVPAGARAVPLAHANTRTHTHTRTPDARAHAHATLMAR